MKLKNYFLSVLAIGALVSCSDDVVGPDKPQNIEPDALFSLTAHTNVVTRAGVPTGDEATQDGIIDLTVAVFDNGAYETGLTGNDAPLVAIKTVELPNTNGDDLTEVTDIPVKSGALKILVLANVKDKLSNFNSLTPNTAGVNLGAFLALSTELEKEAVVIEEVDGVEKQTKGLTMSSAVIPIIVLPGKNYLGYSEVLWSTLDRGTGRNISSSVSEVAIGTDGSTDYQGIMLYRTVSRVQLTDITIVRNSEWGNVKEFKLESVFMMNVKGNSLVASSAGWGSVEASAYSWYDGSALAQVGTWKTHTNGIEKTGLSQDETWKLSTSQSNTYTPPYFFYVYENTSGPDYTLLVAKGTITYVPKGFTDNPATNITKTGYYPVMVNKGDVDSYVGVAAHDYVKRNVKYNIAMTIAGPGYDSPVDPEASACLAAKVKVLDWNVVDMKPVIE